MAEPGKSSGDFMAGAGVSDSDMGSFPPVQPNAASPLDDVAEPYSTNMTRQDLTVPEPAVDNDAPTSHSLSADDADAASADAVTAPAPPVAPAAPPKRPAPPANAAPKSEAENDAATLAQLFDSQVLQRPDAAAAARGAIALLDKRYELKRKLGEGGMGIVFLAFDRLGDCEVAIKTLRPRFLADAESRKRFIDEAKQMNKVPSHAHVLVVKGFGTENRPYYVMENMSGGSLGKLIRKEGPLPRQRIIKLAIDVAKAIEYLHESSGQIHRDIKPENVLLAPDGSAWLCDFGLIRQVGIGSQGLRAGTLAYMPPEVVSDVTKNVAFDWDIYSFGAVLYEMLCGKRPYDELFTVKSSPLEQMKLMKEEVLKRAPLPVAQVCKKADPALTRISQWCMAREARERYYRVGDVLADLERAAQGRQPLGPRQDGTKKAQPRRRTTLVGASIILMLALPGGYVAWQDPFGWQSAGASQSTPGDGQITKAGSGPIIDDKSPPTDKAGADPDKSKDGGTATVTPPPPDGQIKTGDAIIDAVNPAAPFKVEVADESDRRVLFEGDVAAFVVVPQRQCYLTVLMIDLDYPQHPAAELVPNPWQSSGPYPAGESVRAPSLETEKKFRMRINPPHGRVLVKVIATTKPIRLVTAEPTPANSIRPLKLTGFKVAVGEDPREYDSLAEALKPSEWTTAELIVTTSGVTDPR